MPLINRPFDERVLGLKVEDVELVDPGRNYEEGSTFDLTGGRRLLEKLH